MILDSQREKVQQFYVKGSVQTYYPSFRNVFLLTYECDKLKERMHSLGIWQRFHESCCTGIVAEVHEVRCSFKSITSQLLHNLWRVPEELPQAVLWCLPDSSTCAADVLGRSPEVCDNYNTCYILDDLKSMSSIQFLRHFCFMRQ